MRFSPAQTSNCVHTMDQGEKWLARELELSQKHEELLLRREALLRGTERYHHHQENRSTSFISDIKKANERNEELLADLEGSLANLRRVALDPGTPRFNTLKNNYYAMVKNVFPVWLDDLDQFERRHHRSKSKSGRRSPSSSPRLTGRRSPNSSPRFTGRGTPSPTLPSPRARSPSSARLTQSQRPFSTSPQLTHRSMTNTPPLPSPNNTLKSSLKSSMKTTTRSNRSR